MIPDGPGWKTSEGERWDTAKRRAQTYSGLIGDNK